MNGGGQNTLTKQVEDYDFLLRNKGLQPLVQTVYFYVFPRGVGGDRKYLSASISIISFHIPPYIKLKC